MNALIGLVERGLAPDAVVRRGIVSRMRDRAKRIERLLPSEALAEKHAFVAAMHGSPVALVPEKANEQHYEVPPAFFARVLGPRRKYSCCYYPEGVKTLPEAEDAALALTCERAGLTDGMRVLELGCGWGSLSLWMAERYPAAQILAVSNSNPQREYIEGQANDRGFGNLTVQTADMNGFAPEGRFDRVVSLEMFEHMRNWPELFRRLSTWLTPGGRAFIHVFCHRDQPYLFEDANPRNWMARHFFSGGIMPSDDLPYHLHDHLEVEGHWRIDGRHYWRTCYDWLRNLDAGREDVLPILRNVYGEGNERLWLQRWRLFFMACAELFGYRGGREWFVSHYLLRPRG